MFAKNAAAAAGGVKRNRPSEAKQPEAGAMDADDLLESILAGVGGDDAPARLATRPAPAAFPANQFRRPAPAQPPSVAPTPAATVPAALSIIDEYHLLWAAAKMARALADSRVGGDDAIQTAEPPAAAAPRSRGRQPRKPASPPHRRSRSTPRRSVR